MHYFAGLDIGTTHTKLVICSNSPDVLFQDKLGYEHGFGATLDAEEVYSNITILLERAGQALDLKQHQLSITCSAAMHSLVLVDENSGSLSPLYTWADNQAQAIMPLLKSLPSAENLFFETGTPLHPMAPLCKLAWLHHEKPELLQAAFKCVGIKELVWFRLTGLWEIDYSLASATGLFSQKTLSWHPDALQIAGIGPEKLSLPVPFNRKISIQNFHWIIGASDGCLAQLGAGAMEPGTAALTIGTSGALRITSSRQWIDEKKELFTYILDQDYYVCGGATNNGGLALQWWEGSVMGFERSPESVAESFSNSILQVPPGADGLVCLPYFCGERAPVWNAAAKGIFSGLSIQHTQDHLKRSILEGIGFSFRLILQKLEAAHGSIHTIFASGGFSQNQWWVQLMADILQKPLLVQGEMADASALGAIAMGLKAEGVLNNWPEFTQRIQLPQKCYIPDKGLATIYQSNYEHFCRLCQF